MKLSPKDITCIVRATLERESVKGTGFSGIRSMRLTPMARRFLIKGGLLASDGIKYTKEIEVQ